MGDGTTAECKLALMGGRFQDYEDVWRTYESRGIAKSFACACACVCVCARVRVWFDLNRNRTTCGSERTGMMGKRMHPVLVQEATPPQKEQPE